MQSVFDRRKHDLLKIGLLVNVVCVPFAFFREEKKKKKESERIFKYYFAAARKLPVSGPGSLVLGSEGR